MTPELPQAAEQQPRGMGEVARLGGVLFEPGKTFEDIGRRPTFLLPMLLTMIMALIFVSLIGQRIGWERVVRQQMESNPRTAQLPPEAREQQVQMGAKFGPLIGYAGIIVGLPIGYLIWSALLLGIVKGIMSAPVTLKQMFAAVSWGSIPGLVFSALCMVVLYLKPPDDFNLRNPLVFNPGAMMDPQTTSKFLYSLASSLDLFMLWSLILIGLGVRGAAGRKLSTSGAMMAVFVPWIIWTLGKAALAGVFS